MNGPMPPNFMGSLNPMSTISFGIMTLRISVMPLRKPLLGFAIVTFTVQPDIKVPADTSATIESESLLGGRYLSLVPGGDDRMLNPGQEIRFTQASVSLEQLLGKFLGGGLGGPTGGTPAPAPAAPPANTGLLPGLTAP